MGYTIEDNCNGCPDCIHCRLGRETRKVFYCDSCGEDYDKDELRRYNDQDVCRECFLEMMDEEWRDLPEAKED